MNRLATLVLGGVTSVMAYVPNTIDMTLHRTDYANIHFLSYSNIAAGLTNGTGNVWITADSSPGDAINGALGAWNAISTTAARFAPVQPASAGYQYDIHDGNNVIVFSDDAFVRSFTGGVLALTATLPFTDGRIADTDIFFSPLFQFSTTSAPGTYDMQAVLTHELGHALGANHTNIISATMYYATAAQETHKRTLSPDDIAFVSSLYPPAGGNGYGTLSGVTTVAGAPLHGGLLTAVNPDTGATVGGFSSLTDGSFSLQAPPGNYYLYVEPAVNLSLYASNPQNTVFTSFESAFAGGNSQPSLLQLTSGATITANMDAASGTTPLKTPAAAIGIAGVTGDYHGAFSSDSIIIPSGQAVDFLFGNPLPVPIAESNIQLIGPVKLRAGSLRIDPGVTIPDGTPVYRFTLDIPALASNTSATLVIRNGSDIVTRSGVLYLTRPQSVNAASFLGGAVAPGEILSFFGTQIGPQNPVSNSGFDSSGKLPTSLGGITISFDQTAAPLFYVSASQVNLQVPYEISGRASTLMTVSYNGSPVASSTLSVAPSAPGIFVVTNADGSVNGPNAPSPAGAVLVIYGTGAGVTSGSPGTGAAAPSNSTVPATVTIAGKTVIADYSGLTPGSVGLMQVNVAIPVGTPSGAAVPLQVFTNGAATQTVNIAVR